MTCTKKQSNETISEWIHSVILAFVGHTCFFPDTEGFQKREAFYLHKDHPQVVTYGKF